MPGCDARQSPLRRTLDGRRPRLVADAVGQGRCAEVRAQDQEAYGDPGAIRESVGPADHLEETCDVVTPPISWVMALWAAPANRDATRASRSFQPPSLAI